MNVSDAGRKLIEAREGIKLKAYQDSVGVWTIGVGHTSAAGPPKVSRGLTITSKQADDILKADLSKVEHEIATHVRVSLAQNEFDALASLVFNIGSGHFESSTVLRLLNTDDKKGAADAFLMWRNAGGKPILLHRRQDERDQFLGTL